MSTHDKEFKYITSYLKALDFHFLDTWVLQCINYCKSATPNISLETLKNTVKQQWLLVNLRDLKIPAFPPNLTLLEKTILQGRYAVQVESMIDCSKSFYSQLLNLRNVNFDSEVKEEAEVNIKSTRCLIFVITDGVQELKAMEFRVIKKIKVNDPTLLPGFKMVIIGPVECRKGMLLLKDENVRLCGGEVDTLITSNSLLSLLMKKLDISEEDLPSNFQKPSNNQNVNDQTQSSKNINCGNENIETLLSENDDIFFNLPTETFNLIENTSLSSNQNISTFESDIHNDSDFIILGDGNNSNISFSDSKSFKKRSLPLEEKFSSNTKKFSYSNKVDSFSCKQNIKIETITKSCEIETMSSENDVIVEAHISKNLIKEEINQYLKAPVQTKIDFFLNKSNLTNTCNVSEEKNKILNKKFIKPSMISSKPFVYLKSIKSVTLKTPAVYKVKCGVLTLKTKITIENEKFNLKGVITDGSDSIDANFCSSIIENILDYSPCEMEAMMKSRITNSAINSQIKEALKKAQEKFINLNCLMKVKFFPDDTTPVILSLEELTLKHLNELMQRRLA